MALHQRQQIREAVAAQLKGVAPDFATSAQGRVYETRLVPFRRLELPAVAVYALEETSDDQRSAPREYKRTLQLAIEGAVKLTDNVDDALDALALELERAVDADPTFGDTASDSVLASTVLDIVEDSDRSVGVVRLQYSVTYYTYAPDAADHDFDELQTVDVKTRIGGVADPAEDKLEDLGGQP